jgi:hypothetical protein
MYVCMYVCVSNLLYTKVLTVGKEEKYWGGMNNIRGLCSPYNPTVIEFPGYHAQEHNHSGVVSEAMTRLLSD